MICEIMAMREITLGRKSRVKRIVFLDQVLGKLQHVKAVEIKCQKELVTFERKIEELSDKKREVSRDHFLSMDLLILDIFA